MLERSKKFIIAFLIFGILAAGNLFAQPSSVDLADRYLSKAEEAMDNGNVDDAYKFISTAMKMSKTSEDDIIPVNIISFATMIYRQRLKEISAKYDEAKLIDVKSNLESFPEVNTPEISKMIKKIEAARIEAVKNAEKRQQQQLIDNTTKAIDKMMDQNEQTNKRMEDLAKRDIETKELLLDATKTNQSNFRNVFILMIVIVVVILLIVLLIVVIVRAAAKHSRIQQAQYVEAFKMLAANQNQTNQLMIGGIAGLYGDDGLKLAGSSSAWSQEALPPPEETQEEKEELRELAAKCEDLGAKIDQVTGRKNNSKNVSELVYKLAIKLGVHQHEAMIYFCAAMVYDAGFLAIDPEIMQAEELTPEQRKDLQRHVDLAEEYLQFVPKRYWEIFQNAAHLHHENMDGSGSPESLKGEEIPKIARIIRVADSFNALSSRRSYRGGTDKESALEMLDEKANLYDQDVIAALKEII